MNKINKTTVSNYNHESYAILFEGSEDFVRQSKNALNTYFLGSKEVKHYLVEYCVVPREQLRAGYELIGKVNKKFELYKKYSKRKSISKLTIDEEAAMDIAAAEAGVKHADEEFARFIWDNFTVKMKLDSIGSASMSSHGIIS